LAVLINGRFHHHIFGIDCSTWQCRRCKEV